MPGSTSRARRLRSAGNQAEALLWTEVKARRLNGFKFVRQSPVGPYIVDFLCREKRLMIELDGSQHAGSADDERRDAFLTAQGYAVLGFWSADMVRDRPTVLATIVEVLEGRLTENTNAPDLKYKVAIRRGRGDD
ncbi:DUF559 domain-containing protein [Oricola sp.]|uniref:endonuclease domain-containing protein n=1 Tax=Oricola sp. TaxID=1979950 RepID=UPI0025FC79E1|nr:DUF559 domain-containing protein [Oricola sp.]MCI5075182.1 DUF559 domain-containing protein [Oricola sp.]